MPGAAACRLDGVPQLEVLDLAGLVARQRLDEPDFGRNGERLKMLPAMGNNVAGGEFDALPERDARDHLLAEEVAGNPDDRAFPHPGEEPDDLGNRFPVNVVAALYDEIVCAPDDKQLAIRIETGEISGPMPSLWIGGARRRGAGVPVFDGPPLLQM